MTDEHQMKNPSITNPPFFTAGPMHSFKLFPFSIRCVAGTSAPCAMVASAHVATITLNKSRPIQSPSEHHRLSSRGTPRDLRREQSPRFLGVPGNDKKHPPPRRWY